MEIVEQFIQSRTGDMDYCEDSYMCNEHYAVVIDGATNVSGQFLNGKTPGKLATILIKNTIEHLNGQETIQQMIQAINENYQQLYKRLNMTSEMDENPYLRPSASMIIYSKYFREIWMIGDCQAFYGGKNYQNNKKIDLIFQEARSIFVQAELLKGKTEDQILVKDHSFEHIKPFIQKQYCFQNKTPICPLSYAVVNGYDIPDQLIKTLTVPKNIKYISLASDGYPKIYGTLHESEQELKRLLEVDPLCIKENKGVRGISEKNLSYDDRTYIKVNIE